MLLHFSIYTGLLLLVNSAQGAVKLSVNPASGNVRLGESMTIICKAEGGDVDSIAWYNAEEDEVEESEHTRVTGDEYTSQLHIIAAVPEVGGMYLCRANEDTDAEIRKSITISVIQDPIFNHLLPVQEFEEGSDALVKCHVSGIPIPVVSWRHPQKKIHQSERYTIDSTGNLVIKNIQASDAGTYQCVGTIAERQVEKDLPIKVNVNHVPIFVPVDPHLLYSWLGNPVNLSCTFWSYPRAEITWSRSGSDLGGSGRVFLSENSTQIRSVLQLPVNSTEDFSEYRCNAGNSRGSASGTLILREGGIPSPPRDVTADPHSTTIEVSFSGPDDDGGIPILGYLLEWRRNSTREWNRMRIDRERSRVSALDPYTPYQIRVAAFNGKGEGNYSGIVSTRTLSMRGEPDRPVVSTRTDSMSNNIQIFFEDVESGGSPVLRHFVRYKEDLTWGSDYELQIQAENSLGQSLTTYLNVSTPQRPPAAAVGERPKVGTGGVVGIILVIFLALLLVVDAVCYRTRRCGIFMCLAANLLGRREPEHKSLDHEADQSACRMTSSTDKVSSLTPISKHC
ncbi:neural cell adhesion molecule 1-like isoform X2 [Pristis pectinata]|uniref:neural cell adhesion molecule 1-like isoform X2 n=1 Tax=Pristis pectinata TaxID=685728 RepID=UPI00223E484C|nr:neural cell adhesion molecule 1-like isoform X2 [Pristis pectinata]